METFTFNSDLAPLDGLDSAGSWDAFKVAKLHQRVACLRDLGRSNTPVTIGAPGGATVTASLWSVDPMAGRIHFTLVESAPLTTDVAALPQAWAAAYLGSAKLQFLLRGLLLFRTPGRAMLQADLPPDLYKLPRRRAVRINGMGEDPPKLIFQHPLATELQVCLRAVDISDAGCALFKPTGTLPLELGTELRAVEVELDDQTILFTDLIVQNLSPGITARRAGARVGCRWHRMPEPALKRLQGWIKHRQHLGELAPRSAP